MSKYEADLSDSVVNSSDNTRKTVAPCHSGCGTVGIPSCSELKAMLAKYISKFAALSLVMVDS
jgi:hypothetical protein